MDNKNKRILFIAQYPENISPGQRFRFELYKDVLLQNGFQISSQSFLNEKNYAVNYKPGLLFLKAWVVIKGFIKRISLLLKVKKFDYIFIYREAAPVGPPVLEWLFSKVLRKKVIYDFDDAIWMPYMVTEGSFLTRFFKNKAKVKKICRWAATVSCGNKYLCDYAGKYNRNIVYNPTCVDTQNRYNILARHDVKRVTLGWTGSFSTLNYLESLEPVLKKLQEKYEFDIKVICNREPRFHLKNVNYIEWTHQNELTELASCQVGLMPLADEAWSEGKCGFKLIQYLALEIPAVSSPFGVNKKIIDHGENGFLCSTEEEWYAAIEKLILDAALRVKLGKAGRKKIQSQYSLESNKDNFLGMFS